MSIDIEDYVRKLSKGARFKVIADMHWSGSYTAIGEIVEVERGCDKDNVDVLMYNRSRHEHRSWHTRWSPFLAGAICQRHFE